MNLICTARGLVTALVPVLALIPTPALAQGDGPVGDCLASAAGDASAFEACLVEHQDDLAVLYDLPSDWQARLHAYLAAHPGGWDELEDLVDRFENRRDRFENRRDRREDVIDRLEDRRDDRVDLEDVFDRREDARDRLEDRRDGREGVRDRIENRWDRRH